MFQLPQCPAGQNRLAVKAWRQAVTIPTYEPHAPDKNPMFLEKRVYQGSSGRVYPLPFTDRIASKPSDRKWDAVHLENEFVRVMLLPEIGGRIHVGLDKTNGYDFFYRQNVIKPALVGLAGSWISGGVEFNWPQHHRPSTFMPADVHMEEHADGARTVWFSEHDPMSRMKGMHGVCLRPGKSFIELKVRLYNRTPFVQTFLWWANVAARVHERYQSFFPPDVTCVADHAKRAMSTYPLCSGKYYSVPYAERARTGVPDSERPAQFVPLKDYAPNDLSWYANIPVPTSYMCMGSQEDFFGGYDHAQNAGFVHIANHHISPGKKQWTWGNQEFGYAWDRNLTDSDGPYIELMAGVYTDNQPDFSFLQPGECKTFSQYWYPIQQIGPAQHANLDAALSLTPGTHRCKIGVAVSSLIKSARATLLRSGSVIARFERDLAPDQPLIESVELPDGASGNDLVLNVEDASGCCVIQYVPKPIAGSKLPDAATEPPLPAVVAANDELYIIGLHLDQYRHATRMPDAYWREALRRDPGDSRCNNALGLWHLRRGEFALAEECFKKAITRLTRRNPNPYDGEAYYNLGLALRYQLRNREAYAAFYKAAWNYAWQAAGYQALAELDCLHGDWRQAADHLERSLKTNTENQRARNLLVIVLRKLGEPKRAQEILDETIRLDPLDHWALHLQGDALACGTQVRLDLALDYARAGIYDAAIGVLRDAQPESGSGTAPLVHYYLASLYEKTGETQRARDEANLAACACPDYCFPARLEEIAILEEAIARNRADARAPYYLGNLLYDRRRHAEALVCWERAAMLDPAFSIVWRNLGIGGFNVQNDPNRARDAFDRALAANPHDARVLFERDQLWKRLGDPPQKRLRELEANSSLVRQRDDLSVELCALYNQTAQPEKALEIIRSRNFQPWEGGEGLALQQHIRTHLALGRAAMRKTKFAEAREHFAAALQTPQNLGEARILLGNYSDAHYWLAEACAAAGDHASARQHWETAANFQGDFQEMSVRPYSEMTCFQALSLRRLGRGAEADELLRGVLAFAENLLSIEPRIDYFATSLPAMLLFHDDLKKRQTIRAEFLMAQACLGLGDTARAQSLLKRVLENDPNHALAPEIWELTFPAFGGQGTAV